MPIKRIIRNFLEARGKVIVQKSELDNLTADIPAQSRNLFASVAPYTMTSLERVTALQEATRYICSAEVPGAFVECGVWRGGSVMAMAKTILDAVQQPRDVYCFDTFEGMPDAEAEDIDFLQRDANSLLQSERESPEENRLNSPLLAYCSLEQARKNILATGYPTKNLLLIKGRVENTIPQNAPENIALLHLDTDWYESTRHELTHLFPRVGTGGIVIIDDYGHWQGARRAVDEYFAEHSLHVYLHRIDYTGRLIIKLPNQRGTCDKHAN